MKFGLLVPRAPRSGVLARSSHNTAVLDFARDFQGITSRQTGPPGNVVRRFPYGLFFLVKERRTVVIAWQLWRRGHSLPNVGQAFLPVAAIPGGFSGNERGPNAGMKSSYRPRTSTDDQTTSL
jgi:hypothetical protein